ncbi:MAG: phosphatase PAP2 family protein [Anaeroplasmataceae bacterium]|nr:phosphatase PAP2 family protein [Anaeroplasmataceae bacterium]
MKKVWNKFMILGLSCIGIFLILFILLLTVDKHTNVEGEIGLYNFNKVFVVDQYYESWDSLSDVILYMSLGFLLGLAIYGLYQLISRKSLFKVDKDILFVGCGILILILLWVLFDKVFIVNYRPILIDKEADASFPSTHVMLSTFILLSSAHCITKRNSKKRKHTIFGYLGLFILAYVCILGRLLSCMHWMTDVLGGFLLGFGLFNLVVGLDKIFANKEKMTE